MKTYVAKWAVHRHSAALAQRRESGAHALESDSVHCTERGAQIPSFVLGRLPCIDCHVAEMDLYYCACPSSTEDKRAAAGKPTHQLNVISDDCFSEKDIRRLKSNWLFLMFVSILRVINYICVIPTNHQFIINPTAETLNITVEVNYTDSVDSLLQRLWLHSLCL